MSASHATGTLARSTEERLALIAKLNPRIHAMLTVAADQARLAAAHLDAVGNIVIDIDGEG